MAGVLRMTARSRLIQEINTSKGRGTLPIFLESSVSEVDFTFKVGSELFTHSSLTGAITSSNGTPFQNLTDCINYSLGNL